MTRKKIKRHLFVVVLFLLSAINFLRIEISDNKPFSLNNLANLAYASSEGVEPDPKEEPFSMIQWLKNISRNDLGF